MATLKEYILYCKKKLERGVGEDKTLHILRKLHKFPVTVELLQETGIGKVVKSLKKYDGEIGDRSRAIINDWMQMVSQNLSSDQNSRSEKKTQKNEEIAQKSQMKSQKYYSERPIKEENFGRNKKYEVQQQEDYSSSEEVNTVPLLDSRSISGSSGYYSNDGDDYETEIGSSYKLSSSHQPNKSLRKSNEELHRHSSHPSKYENKHKNLTSVDSYNNKPEKQSTYNGDICNVSASNNKHRGSPVPSSKDSKHPKNVNYGMKSEANDLKLPKKPVKENRKSSTKQKTVKKLIKIADSEGFTNSVASFEDCLGLNDAVKVTKKKPVTKPNVDVRVPKKHHKDSVSSTSVKEAKAVKKSSNEVKRSSEKKKNSYSRESDPMPENLKRPKLVPLEEVDILSTLPAIQPNYKPLRIREPDSPPRKKRSAMTNEEAIMFTSSRKDRTNVYAGRRTLHRGEAVPSLYDICIRILIENIDALAYTGGVPFDVLKPVIERCSPSQLYCLEDHNPYMLEDTDYLWKAHCQKDFKAKQPDEHETWRDLYLRSYDEREAKFKNVAAYISESMKKATPVRQTKLAYVDSVAKPPRDVRRRQAKHGTGSSANIAATLIPKPIPLITPASRSASPVTSLTKSSSSSSSSMVMPAQPKVLMQKPKVAPLMQKTLKLMKQQFRR